MTSAGLALDTAIDFPHGTISAYVDIGKGVLVFFMEPRQHPEDLELAWHYADMAGGGVTCLADADVDIRVVQIDPALMERFDLAV